MEELIAKFNAACANKKGFTLAEVLITLAIIGVVAALTIPTVVRNYQERQTVSSIKKFYSQISQAFKLAEIRNGSVDTWDWGTVRSGESADKIIDILAPYLKITKRCGKGKGCFWNGNYKNLNGNTIWTNPENNSEYAKARLADGMSFFIVITQSNCATGVCGNVDVDINGDKKPNQVGRDIFMFVIQKNGSIAPSGIGVDLSTRCSRTNDSAYSGHSCTAWVIAKDNMDYLHKNVSW